MSHRFPSALKSSLATFGYEADGFIMSMVDVVGIRDDDSAVPMGEACIVGDSPTGIFATLSPGTVAFHRIDPDVWDFMTPWEVRIVFNKELNKNMVWDPATSKYAWKIMPSVLLPIGSEGQVLYNLDDGTADYEPDHLLKIATIVINDDELNEHLAEIVTLQTIYDSWQRISHGGNGLYPSNASELNGWQYAGDSIQSTINSVTYIGFVSPKLYDQYTFDLTAKSTSTDDDCISMIVAFTASSTGVEHTLSAIRSAGGVGSSMYWALVYDMGQPTQRVLVNKSGPFVVPPNPTTKGWADRPNGCRIVCKRDMHRLFLQTSPLDSLTIDPSGDISFDLTSDPDTLQFVPACAMGVGCYSQANTTYVINDLIDSDLIIDARTNTTYMYSFTAQAWQPSSLTLDDIVGVGRFVWSDFLERLYYNFGDDVFKKLSSKNLIQV